jgi:hypothetical protein
MIAGNALTCVRALFGVTGGVSEQPASKRPAIKLPPVNRTELSIWNPD